MPAPVVTEHRAQTRRCGCCGATTTAPFPEAVRARVAEMNEQVAMLVGKIADLERLLGPEFVYLVQAQTGHGLVPSASMVDDPHIGRKGRPFHID